MGLHVMDGHQRPPQGESGGLRPADTYQERPDEAGARGDRHGVNVAHSATRFPQRPVDHLVDTLDVGHAPQSPEPRRHTRCARPGSRSHGL